MAKAHALYSAGCNALAGALASGGQGAALSNSLLAVDDLLPRLSHVSCYGMRTGAEGESVAWVSPLGQAAFLHLTLLQVGTPCPLR